MGNTGGLLPAAAQRWRRVVGAGMVVAESFPATPTTHVDGGCGSTAMAPIPQPTMSAPHTDAGALELVVLVQ